MTNRFDDLAGELTTNSDTDEREPSSWSPVDLTAALDGDDIPAPAVLRRSDGVALLYAGRTHTFSGEPESCKTWGAGLAVVQVLDDGGTVVWIDFEDDERGTVARLRALGASTEAIRDRFTYVRPEEPLYTRDGRGTAGAVDFGELLAGRPFELAVVDGITEAMTTEGLDPMSNADVATWMRRVPKRIAASGAATLGLDHLTKNRETQGRYSIGAQHKLAGITGAAYKFEVRRPLARAVHDAVEGSVLITVTKDRPGHVRAQSSEGRAGVLELTAWPDGTVSGSIMPATNAKGPDLALVKAIAEYLDSYEGATVRRVQEGVTGKAEAIREALRWMAATDREWVVITKVGQAHQHTLTTRGRDELELDDH